jgi:hypothetical protein
VKIIASWGRGLKPLSERELQLKSHQPDHPRLTGAFEKAYKVNPLVKVNPRN